MEENKSIERAKEVLDRISQDEEEREMAYRRERAIRDQNASIASGYNKGKSEGKIEGRIEGRIEKQKEIAKNLLKENLGIDVISRVTDLDIEEIKKLK